jgi:uncharacterized protein
MAEIAVTELGDRALLRDYRAELIGQVLIERGVWGPLEAPITVNQRVVARSGYIWFRFWIFPTKHVVNRYYDAGGALIGTHVDVCSPPRCDDQGCRATDLLLDVWITPEGQVTVENESGYEAAIADGSLTPADAELAERQLRELTRGIAAGHFPPSLVRNWQVDLQRVLASVR